MSYVHATPGTGTLLRPLDTLLRVETPEGIDLFLRPAGLVPRALAFAIDLAIRGSVLGVLGAILLFQGDLGVGALMMLFFLFNWLYMALFEGLRQGRSPGKQLMGLQVVHRDGTPIGWPAALLRNLLRAVDALPFGYALGLTCCLLDSSFRRLGDLAAGTQVVYREATPKAPDLPQVPAEPAPFPLSVQEQRALIELAERQASLAPARVQELAALMAPALGVADDQAMPRIERVARALVGPAV
ncbi:MULTISPECIES: RDD family protein [unclassified Pseudomonas]|uniref:RDD family protein n=1 Tax=unclassified Pseudomonas TaxID=196821 RepID=UPI000BDA03F8|nr:MULTISPECIES: RDD family protein [unclassified Pseudomonas]PVZ11195.1 putative RDD family membrane protein YckC [Pseudomonas sp. URIL14HWK12:I12]PVZ22193.1 putative RDD family membrane protein YckC [Pseudomonas sp. URIL14HWK12:I10]PVZ31683.1 putative RDD family membrane protein YckC [Pseudomonas sp. URIL14HWK12:I11]SNZ16795.1 Uncharacterized membrane protein YckC, RDD family [Pseudomonas sp. URIL14HWK12:I9]